MKRTPIVYLVVAGLSVAAFVAKSPARENSGDAAAVRRVLSGIVAADNAGDLEAIVAHYAEDAILLPPNDAAVIGKAAIRSRYEEGLRHFRFDIRFTSEETQVSGDWAFVRGMIRGRVVSKGDKPGRTLEDKFLMIVRREKGGWKIARLIWNGSSPAEHSS